MIRKNVAILIFDGVELLDFAGPFEVFSAARPSLKSNEKLLNVFTVAESPAPVTCNNPLVVMPKYTLDDCPPIDILLVPGGQGTRSAIERPALIDWIAARDRETELTTSVCTGSFLLAKAGLLDGRRVVGLLGLVAIRFGRHFTTCTDHRPQRLGRRRVG